MARSRAAGAISSRAPAGLQGPSRVAVGTIGFLLLFLGTVILAHHQDWLDRPAAIAVNNLAVNWPFAGWLAAGLAYPSVEGVIALSLVWGCWFSVNAPQSRARLVSGVFAGVLAGVLAYLVQHALPPMPKPLFDPLLRLHPPAVLGDFDASTANPFAASPTFPSERATMFAGLAIAVLLIRRRLGLLALGCTMLVESSRIFLGLHYPSDIMGSYFLAGTIACLGQMRAGVRIGRLLVEWEEASPATFYMCAYFASYEMTSGFADFRELIAQI